MSLRKTFNFLDPTLYTFDGDLIDFTISQKPRLKLQDNPGQDFTEDFANDTGFTYDNTKAEFLGGVLQQKDQRPTDATFGASYTNDINGNWGEGVLTGTAYNGASVSGGKLDLSGSSNKYIDYDADLNADMQQVGCIRFKWTPKYSGAGSFQYLFTIVKGVSLPNNRIRIYHQSTLLFLSISDQAGGSIVSMAEVFSPVADTEYEIELNWDLTTGATRLFVDGNQLGATQTGTGTRDANIGLLRLGKDLNGNGNANFLIDDLLFFDTIQHTTNYTKGYSVSDYLYAANTPILPEMEYTGVGTLISFDSFTTTETGSPKYSIQVGRSGNYLYWDGAAWSTSDGTYAQANDATTFNTNVGDLDIEGEIYGQFKVHFMDSNIQSKIDELTVSLTAQIYPISNPTITIIEEFGIETLENFFQNAIISGNDQIKYIITKNGMEYYFNGSIWVISDGTYTQSNTADEIDTNKAILTTMGIDFGLIIFLHSDNGITTPVLNSITIDYDFFAGLPTEPSKCIIYGYCYEGDGNDLDDVIITAYLNDIQVIYNDEISIFREEISTTPDSEGYWELELINTALMESGTRYIFKFIYENETVEYIKQVPNETRKNFAELED